ARGALRAPPARGRKIPEVRRAPSRAPPAGKGNAHVLPLPALSGGRSNRGDEAPVERIDGEMNKVRLKTSFEERSSLASYTETPIRDVQPRIFASNIASTKYCQPGLARSHA